MTGYAPPVAEMRFVLDRIAGLGGLTSLPGLEAATPDLVGQVLEEAGRFAANELAPLNQVGDREGAVLENGVVRTAPGFAEAYHLFAAAGWNGLVFPERWGGQDLPWALNAAVSEMWNAANMSFQLCPLLTQAAIEALLHHGSEALQARYLPKLVSGEWTGAMCLTEPHAGSDVGALRTRARRDGKDYRITGQKIYITYGDHDMAANIVHLVLARLPDAPDGTRGISLFLVPKLLPNPDGTPGARNDVRCVSLEHKLGIRASPTCVISYGDDEGALGFLIGRENEGMRCMFTMMNNARIAVGIEGLGLAERAYQQALEHARERIQGRRGGSAARIIEYPDVRRMLATMRAQISAMRALCYTAAAAVDRSCRAPDAEARRQAEGRVALLTPIVKAWCTDLACEIASTAVQVHGGMGYIEETGAAQHYRDARILPIYEGTNGIQAHDLALRKLQVEDGRLPRELIQELKAELQALRAAHEVALADGLEPGLVALDRATRYLQGPAARNPDALAAAATPYLRLFGQTLGGFLLARGAVAAAGDPAGAAWPALARFYVHQLLPPAVALLPAICRGDETLHPALLPT
ncbi:MAG TPA: acyl-CoA dehydrogenase [Geminicoccaceae bacterium]|nr:acyl-CoA dehydrogenase [Geminicoccaceae bacterium]